MAKIKNGNWIMNQKIFIFDGNEYVATSFSKIFYENIESIKMEFSPKTRIAFKMLP